MTKFCGHKTGFNPSGKPNDAAPRADASDTNYTGRPAIGRAGKLKNTPTLTAATAAGNRRLAKSNHGAGNGSGTVQRGTNAFSKAKR